MSNVLIGIIGVVLFVGLAIAAATYFGPQLFGSKVNSQASDYLAQTSQISKAVQDYVSDNGALPISGSTNPVSILVTSKYLKSAPPGGSSPWVMNTTAAALLTPVAGSSAMANSICVAARTKAGMTTPGTVLKCDGSTGTLRSNDPCCLM